MKVALFTPEQIYRIFRFGDTEEITDFFDALPSNQFKDVARPLVTTDNIGMSVVAMGNLVLGYCNGQNPAVGADLALGLHKLAVELYQADNSHAGLIPTTLTNLAFAYVTACNLLGRSQQVVNFTADWIPFYTKIIPETANISSLHVARAGALLNLNRIDDAQSVLVNTDIPWSNEASIERQRLLNKIVGLKESVTALDETAPVDMAGVINTALQGMSGKMFNNDAARALNQLLANSGGFKTPKSKEEFEQLDKILQMGEAFLTNGTSDKNEWNMQQKLRSATKLFYLNEAPDERSIRRALSELDEILDWAKKNDHYEIKNDALWGYYLCHSRLKDNSKAADNLIELRLSIEKSRAGIKDPLERGGAFSTYPNLFCMLCEKLYRSSRYSEMLESIEAAKGRAMADLLTSATNRTATDSEFYEAVYNLGKLTRKFNFNYLSWFVDEYEGISTIYSVMVDSGGHYSCARPIQMESNNIQQAIMHLEPKLWGRPDVLNPAVKSPIANKLLSPLSKVFEELIDNNILARNDHIVISGDSHLSNVPWYYLPLYDEELIDWFSVSRVHNVYHLSKLLQQKVIRPEKMLGLVLPRQDDLKKRNWQDFHRNISEPINYLKNNIGLSKVQILENEKVTIENLSANLSEDQLIHISTHGYFPKQDSQQNPYHNSGIFMSDGNTIPNNACAVSGKCILTPEKVVKNEMNFHGCHISLMACVSGLSREGLGGDALGMDWALIQAGAESLISTHWDIKASNANQFFQLFYQYWYKEGLSRGKAARKAGLAIKRESNNFEWAAFSMSGDWR